MIQTSPVTGAVGWRYCSEYVYSDSVIWGFTQTHLNGTGCMDLGDILVMPSDGSRRRDWDNTAPLRQVDRKRLAGLLCRDPLGSRRQSRAYSHPHAALHRYTYNRADSSAMLIDLQHGGLAWSEAQYHSHVRLCEHSGRTQ